MQTAITVTSNNIANANTPGYAEETVDLTTATPQSSGSTAIGAGVDVASVTRAVNEVSNSQLNSSQSTLGQLNSLQSYTTQIDNIIGTTAGGVSTALQNYYSGWSTVANDPTSTASRQALLGDAGAVSSAFQSTSSQLQELNSSINSGISSDVSQINSLATSISSLNQQIVSAQAGSSGQAPNDLLDQRDTDLSSLSKLVGVSTTTDSNGALNVFIGSGQPLVLQGSVTQLTTVPNQFNSSQLEISAATNDGNPISAEITSGDLGGLLAARTQALDPTINQVGQLATAFATTANTQQSAGLDLNGNQGTALFTVGAPVVSASSKNTDSVTGTASVTDVGSLTNSNYLLSYSGGAYSLTDETTGQKTSVTPTNATTTPTIAADGLSIVLSGPPAAGDQFLIQPTAQAAAGLGVAITDPSKLAAAGAIQTTAASTNTGGATISSGTVVDAANPALLDTATIAFTGATTYTSTVNGVATTGTLPANGEIAENGWQVQLTGTPATGDTFTVQGNSTGTGDNRNALASADQQTAGVLSGGSISVTGAAGALVTSVGSQAQQVNTAQTAQSAVNTQALANVQSVSGVNLDEEAANLLQWQQAYQASAQALSIGNSTFSTFLSAINGTAG